MRTHAPTLAFDTYGDKTAVAISTPVESMPSNADFHFEFIVPSVFANERGTHVFQNTIHVHIASWLLCNKQSLHETSVSFHYFFYIHSCIDNKFVQIYLFIGEKKGMFLSTMRVDTYFLTSSAPRVFAVKRASSMSSVAT